MCYLLINRQTRVALFSIILSISSIALSADKVQVLQGKSSDDPNTISICTPEWPSYTEKSGNGLYHILWRKVFVESGIKLDIHYMPFKRCFSAFQLASNTMDTYSAGYAVPELIIPKWHLGVDVLTVAYRKDTIDQWQGERSMKDKVVSWERGYQFDNFGIVNVPVKLHEYDSGKLASALQMLVYGRIDFLIDYSNTIEQSLNSVEGKEWLAVEKDALKGPKYYMVFAPTKKGERLARLWDKKMAEMHRSGELTKLYKKYGDAAY